ncbi:MAG: hypothetical protein CBD66_000740 [Flavobacteriaceae bacterium TMED206]|nr:MAG: hypothetical protein CBD66_000740 [Flavobacteriaceae bacterium TMED206]
MQVYWILIFLFFLSCNRNSSSGIIPQTQVTSQEFDRLNTYYIYDYVSKDQLLEYSLKQEHKTGRKSIHYYFSHNANIPSHELKYSESIIEICKILKSYRHSLKFVFVKESSGNEMMIDCLEDPSNLLCNFK